MKLLSYILFFIGITVNAQFTNVMISDQNVPNEPALVIDPNNTNTIFAGSNSNNYYVSNDGGVTWTQNQLTSTYGVWSDPVLLIDNSSNLYYFHLSYPNTSTTDIDDWIDRIVCQKSTDNGVTFNNGTFFGLSADGLKDQDKEWAQIDRNNGNIYVTWSEFDTYGDVSPTCKSRILFVKSLDSGDTWSSPIKINDIDGNCIDEDLTVEGAVPTVGPNGEVYVAWAGPAGIVFNKSTDEGDTWLNNNILIDTMPTGWDYSIPGIDRCNGLPILDCDISGGVYNGTLYVNWTDQRNGTNDTDVWLKKSIDGGETWGNVIRVNDDGVGKHQFLTWMDIDQTNGNIYIVFYDRRNHSENNTDVYLARSTDGGTSFHNILISESPFVPTDNVFFGDYTNIAAHNGVIRPIWNRVHNGNSSIWTALIEDSDIVATDDYFNVNFELNQNYPNPAKDETYISFKLKSNEKVSLEIYSLLGEKKAIIFNNKKFTYGKHIVKIPLSKNKLSQGVYFYKMKIGKKIISKKMIVK